jgi:hypothetical protein
MASTLLKTDVPGQNPGAYASAVGRHAALPRPAHRRRGAARDGLPAEPRFEKYHRTLNQAQWSDLRGAQILLGLLIKLLPPQWPITVGVDETLERRKGQRIAAKGVYRDAVRSSKSKVVTCFGLQWICMALLLPLPWSQRPWALPFLTLLAPSERANQRAGKPHRSTIDWTIVMVRVLARWLQRRPWILIGDGAYACCFWAGSA